MIENNLESIAKAIDNVVEIAQDPEMVSETEVVQFLYQRLTERRKDMTNTINKMSE